MTPAGRIATLVAVVVIAVVGFVVLKPDDGSKKQSSTPSSETTPRTTTGTGTAKTQPAQPPSPPVANVRVKGGKPVGGVQELEFGKGQQVEFFVTSDVADHVHVHGYDIFKDVEPGKRVKFSFKGKLDGEYEVELEDRHEPIASLRVIP